MTSTPDPADETSTEQGIEPGTVVCGRPAPGASFDLWDFVDLTDVPVVSIDWDGPALCVTFAGHLDDDTASDVRLRIVSPSRADEATRRELLARARDRVNEDPDNPGRVLLRDALEHLFRPLASTGDTRES